MNKHLIWAITIFSIVLMFCSTLIWINYNSWTLRFEMDNNTRMAIESIEFPIMDIDTYNNSPEIKPSNSVTKAKIQKPTPDNGTKLGSANSTTQNTRIKSEENKNGS